MMHTDIVASQIEGAVHYAELAVGLIDESVDVPDVAVFVVRHEVISKMERFVLWSEPDLVVYGEDPRLDIEITFVREKGAWTFHSVEFMSRFGPSPWAYITDGDHEICRHDGQIIEWRDEIAAFLREEDRKAGKIGRVSVTPGAAKDIEASLREQARRQPEDQIDTRSSLRRFIDWLKS